MRKRRPIKLYLYTVNYIFPEENEIQEDLEVEGNINSLETACRQDCKKTATPNYNGI
jgi:hypothetical protein